MSLHKINTKNKEDLISSESSKRTLRREAIPSESNKRLMVNSSIREGIGDLSENISVSDETAEEEQIEYQVHKIHEIQKTRPEKTKNSSIAEKNLVDQARTDLPVDNKQIDINKKFDEVDTFPDETKRVKKIGAYVLEDLIGRGSFGKVYKCSRDGIIFALKIELVAISSHSQLKNEYMIYKKLRGIKGVPKVYAFGEHEDCYYMVMEYFGMNLERIHELRVLNFSTAIVLKIGLKLLEIFEKIHSKGIIIRDMKPDNVLVDNKDLYLIDFGMSKYFVKGGKHIPLKLGKELAGTVRYASINTHLGMEQSRRDDLETMLYSLIYLAKDRLPWMGIPAKNRREKFDKICKKKESTSIESLIKDIPHGKVLGDILKYVRGLEFEEKPNYLKINLAFKKALREIGEKQMDFNFEFEKEKQKEEKEDFKKGLKKPKEGFWQKFKKIFCCCFIN
ncbi:Casein kinase I isoform alpha [Cucumispora dikerogammari]|nr:Casein kinase I isoform alpha [Cucumispora dikerogammari]